MRWLDDVSPADWVVERLHPFAVDVGSVIPEGYDAYARIFHEARDSTGSPTTWAAVAGRNGRIAHPQALPAQITDRFTFDSDALNEALNSPAPA